MKKIKILLCTLIMTLSVLTGFSVSADDTTSTSATPSFSVAAKSAIAVDAASGKILYAQNADDSSTAIASVTKLLTAYLVYKNVAEGKLTWETKIPISKYAYELTLNSNASNIPLLQSETYTTKDLLDALLLPSANSAAVALAEKIAGSEPKFVDMMTAQMKAWGANDTHLVNASGLPNSELNGNIYPGSGADATNTMSARDVALLSYHLIKDYPEVLTITGKSTLPFDENGKSKTTLYNTNQMLKGFSTTRSGVDGLKTGSTGLLIDCFAATTQQNGFRIITVVLDATTPASDNSTPFTLTNQLMNYVYGHWTTSNYAKKGQTVSDFKTLGVTDGKEKSVPLVAGEDIDPVVPMAADGTADNSKLSVKFDTKKSASVEAPVSADKKLVTVSTSVKDNLGYLPGSESGTYQLVAKSSVEKSNPLKVFWNHFVIFVNEKL